MLPVPTKETIIQILETKGSFFDNVERIKKESPEIGKIIEGDSTFIATIHKKILEDKATENEKLRLLSVAISQGAIIYLALDAQDKINAANTH